MTLRSLWLNLFVKTERCPLRASTRYFFLRWYWYPTCYCFVEKIHLIWRTGWKATLSKVQTSSAHEVLKWRPAGAEDRNCSPIKTAVWVFVRSAIKAVKVLFCTSRGLVVGRGTAHSQWPVLLHPEATLCFISLYLTLSADCGDTAGLLVQKKSQHLRSLLADLEILDASREVNKEGENHSQLVRRSLWMMKRDWITANGQLRAEKTAWNRTFTFLYI